MSERPQDTGPAGNFPVTRWSAIEAACGDDPAERRRALDLIASLYWKPVYKYVRARHRRPPDDAQDLTQEFFASLVERGTLASYDPRRARLRTFLRSCVDALVATADRDAGRLKRGGGNVPVSLDYELAEGELARVDLPSPDDMDAFFEREWRRSFMARAVEDLRASLRERGRDIVFEAFARYDLDDAEPGRPTYAAIARDLGVTVVDVTNHLAAARRELRRICLERLRETTASDDEFRREARSLLGHDAE